MLKTSTMLSFQPINWRNKLETAEDQKENAIYLTKTIQDFFSRFPINCF